MARETGIRRIPGRRTVLRDPRFIWGVLLIVASVATCVLLVASAGRGSPTLQATRDIAVGEQLDSSNLVSVSARTHSDAYLTDGRLPDGAVAGRSLRKGELVGRADAVSEQDAQSRRVVVPISSGLPASTRVGARLELWHVQGARGGEAPPAVISSSAVLVNRLGSDRAMGSAAAEQIEVLIHVDELPGILAAVGGEGTIVAVPQGS